MRGPRGHVVVVVLALPFLLGVDLLRSKNRQIEEGNERLKAGNAAGALERYDEAVARLPHEPGAHFDRGAALSALGRHDEAAAEFLRATEARVPALKAAAFYNLGNSFYQAGKYGEAIEAYKRSLALAPADRKAKWNLELALRKKREEDEKKKQDPGGKDDAKQDAGKDPKPDQKDPKDQKDQKPEQQKPEPQKPEPQKQQGDRGDGKPPEAQRPEDQQDPQKEEPEPPKPDQGQRGPSEPPPAAGVPEEQKETGGADMREINAVLDSLEQSPKALELERARVRAFRRKPPVKDW